MSAWTDLDEDIAACTRCPALIRYRTHAVPGEGSRTASVMFVGEGPGRVEDEARRPFVGPSGRYLRSVMADVGLLPPTVFITNVVRCRPPGNRPGTRLERTLCMGFLFRRLRLMSVSLIVTLGGSAFNTLAASGGSITRNRGTLTRSRSLDDGRTYPLFPLHHPAAVLHARRRGQTSWEREFRSDMKAVATAAHHVCQGHPLDEAAFSDGGLGLDVDAVTA